MLRPVELFRVAGKILLIGLDNQVRTITYLRGLVDFVHDDTWGAWNTWKGVTLSIDLGSDGLCAAFAALYKYKMNIVLLPDESHSCKNSWQEVIRRLGLTDLWHLLTITANLEFGPRSSGDRRSEIRNALSMCYQDRTPQ